MKVGDQKISDNADWREALRNGKSGKVSVVIVRDKREQTLSMSVPLRKGPDSSALIHEELPETELVIGSLPDDLDSLEPLIDMEELNRAMQKPMEDLHRELINKGGGIERFTDSLKLASAQLKAHGAELSRALREVSRALPIPCGSEMQ